MLRPLAWLEFVAAIMFLAVASWPFSGFCSGRFMGLDCESRAIFGALMYGPLGLLLLACSVWSLSIKSVASQYVLILGVITILAYWLFHIM
jgi:hypothetical protein